METVTDIIVHPDCETSKLVGPGREVDDYEKALKGVIANSPNPILLFDYSSDPAAGCTDTEYWDLVKADRRILTVPAGGAVENKTEAERLWDLLTPCIDNTGRIVIHGTYLEGCVNMFAGVLHDAISDNDASWLTFHYMDRMGSKLTNQTSTGVILEFGHTLSSALAERPGFLWLRNADELVADSTEVYHSLKPARTVPA